MNKLQLIMCIGNVASGKDYWCEQQMKLYPNVYKRINKDQLRLLLDFSVWNGSNEKFIVKARDNLIELALQEGKSVICTDTNLAPQHSIRLKELADKYKAEFVIQDFRDVPVELSLERDAKRSNPVGKKVILQFWAKYLKPKPIEYINGLPDAVASDLDGSLCIFGEKNPYERNFLEDELSKPVAHLIKNRGNAKLILVSGRKDIYRDQTEEWLKKYEIDYDYLFMRKTLPKGETEPSDVIVKGNIYEEYIKDKFNLLWIVDDRKKIKRMWTQKGIFVFDVNQFDLDF